MRGDLVIVRTYGDIPKVRRVWDVSTKAVFACTEERYERLIQDNEDVPATAFPIADVFCYDAATFDKLSKTYQRDPSVWERLTPYTHRLARV